MMLCCGGLDGFDGDRSDFLTDTVAGNDGNAGIGTAVAQGEIGHDSWLRLGCERGLR